jgi:soluble lytic murein transglycosylase-like protein
MKTSLILATFVGLFALTAAVLRMYAEQEPVILSAKIPREIVLSSATVARQSFEESSLFVAAVSSAAATASSSGELHYPTASSSAKERLVAASELSGAHIAGQAAVPNSAGQKSTSVPKTSSTPSTQITTNGSVLGVQSIPSPAQAAEKASQTPQKTARQKSADRAVVAPKVPTAELTTSEKPALPASEWDAVFEQYAAQYGVDARKLKVIAKCESTYRQDAVNGPYGGMYQYLASTWSATRNAMGEDPNPELRFNGEEAIKTTA